MSLEGQISAANSPAAGGQDNRVDGCTACRERSVSAENFSTSAQLLEVHAYAVPSGDGRIYFVTKS